MEASPSVDVICATSPYLPTADTFFMMSRKGSSYNVSFPDTSFWVGRPPTFCSDIDQYRHIRSIERFDEETTSDPFHERTSSDPFHEGTSSNSFPEDNKMLGIPHNLQAPIKHEKETEEGLENNISFNSGVE
ncbi:GDSL esterase/lipase [Cucumis melo var. makuwa]|uniref:GDSL esterase/lipase n=1 Tax=Cucumis melo var. makuwa TaxID=1194695 RepID=A0A5A7V494_CUCMM|nr:GDSL esterase/lipase [Cucumis melo var. makuwa]